MKSIALHWQILIAIVLAAIAGSLSGTEAGIGPLTFHGVYEFIGTIFIKALKMFIVPLIFSSIVVGITGIGRAEDLGKLGAKTIGVFDRVLDMLRTSVNALGDSATALVVARMQGEQTLLASPAQAHRA